MRYISEAAATEKVREKMGDVPHEMTIYSRDPQGLATYRARIAVKVKTSLVTEDLIARLVELAAREDVPVEFVGSKVDIERDIETTYIFLDANVEAKI